MDPAKAICLLLVPGFVLLLLWTLFLEYLKNPMQSFEGLKSLILVFLFFFWLKFYLTFLFILKDITLAFFLFSNIFSHE